MKLHKGIALLLAICGLTVASVDTQATTFSLKISGQKWAVNPDGTMDSLHPTGDKGPSAPTLFCNINAFPGLTGLLTGTPFSHDLRQYFSGTAAATATLGLDATGTNSNLWVMSGDNVTHNATLTGSGSITLRGTTSGNTTNCLPTLSWSFVAPPSTDTTKPSKVTGHVQTGAGTNTATMDWDPSSDPCTGVNCTGIASYSIEKNGTEVATQSASLGLQGTIATTNIGSGSGTHTCTPTGTSLSIVGAGIGLDGTADGAVFCGTQVAGTNSCVSGDVTAASFSGPYNKIGPTFRGTLDANSAALNAYVMRTAMDVYYIQVSSRTTTGASRSNIVAAQPITLPLTIQICRTATNTYVVNSSIAGGNTWSPVLTNYTLSLPATAYAGFSATATEVGTAITGTITNVNINNVARVSKVISTTTAGTFAVRAVDGSGNKSDALAGITLTPGAPPSGTAKKYRPGTYVDPVNSKRIDAATNLNAALALISSTCSNTNIVGYQIVSVWSGYEGETQGDYSAGDAAVTTILNAAGACHKTVMLSVQPLLFNCWAPGNEKDTIPLYIINQYGFTYLTGPAPQLCGGTIRGFTSRWWQTGTRTRYTALLQHLAALCNAHIACEMLTAIGETAINVENGADGFSVAALDIAYKEWDIAMRTAGPNIQTRIGTNDHWPYSMMDSLLNHMRTYVTLPGGPDQRLDSVTMADSIYVGYDEYHNVVFEDRRCATPPANPNCLPWVNEVQPPELDLWSASTLYSIEMNGYTATSQRVKDPVTQQYTGPFFTMPSTRGIYHIWAAAEFTAHKWSTEILPLINSTGGVTYWGTSAQTPCFAIYVNGCDRTLP